MYNVMEIVKEIHIPVHADSVLSPDFLYGKSTGIHFITNDDQFGRITFENLDAVKICRGEVMPYAYDYSLSKHDTWIYEIKNSKWQQERFAYEQKNYGNSYEFGGDVNEMLVDFKHYLFSFHDQFIEVIARGFWFEKDSASLLGKDLMKDHPFLLLPTENMKRITVDSLVSQIRTNQKPREELIHNAQYCSQKLYQFALEFDGKASVDNTVLLSYQKGKLISTLRGYFGRQEVTFDGFVRLEQVLPYIEQYMKEVAERRKHMKK